MLSDLRFRLRSLFLRKRVENELNDELRFHYERHVEKYVQSGLTRYEAERRARLQFGGLDQVKEDCREARGTSFIDTLTQDVRFALRLFQRSPAFTITAVLTLALGIGANTAIFSVVEGVLLKPLPYLHAQELLSVALTPLAVDPSARGLAGEDYFIFREQSRTFTDFGAYLDTDADRDVNVTGFAEPERVHAIYVTDGALSVLGTRAMLGRVFSRGDDSPGAPATVILTYGYWQRRFSASTSVIGKTIVTDGKAREIIGVLPRNFRFLKEQDLALVLPLQLNRAQTRLGNFVYYGIARLKSGMTIADANADVLRMIPIALHAFPSTRDISLEFLEKARLAPSIVPLKEEVVTNMDRLLWVLMAGIALVLLIACANVANLLLVRNEGRRHELALRAALGASRKRIAAQLLHESAVLGVVGGMAGLLLAYLALRAVVRLAPSGLPRIDEIGIDVPVLLFAVAVVAITTLLFGTIPILRQTGVRSGLAEGTRTMSPGRERHRAQNVLVTAQVALALILLVCSGLMIRTFHALTHVNPGFVPTDLQTFHLTIPALYVPDEARVTVMEQQIVDKLLAIPGVSSVAFSSDVPMDGDNKLDNIFVADHSYEPGLPPLRHFQIVSPAYFKTMGIRMIAGRDLTWPETIAHEPVAMVSENFAREHWSSPQAALGKRIRLTGIEDWRQIVGVVGDVHDQGMDRPPRSTAYWPALLETFHGTPLRARRNATFIMRSPLAGSQSFMQQVRQAVWSVDANLPLAGVHTMNYFYQRSMARTSFTLVMLGIAGGMALLLGTVGLYGLIAYSVSQRKREIGVRMALGAQRGHIVSLVLRHGVSIIFIGLACGTVAALALSRLLSSMLFGVRPADPITYATIIPALGIVALAACYLPAWRASQVHPGCALRCE
jgi:predicted permease